MLALTGCRVIDIGVVPTPTVELAVVKHTAAGGIAITASHNPAEWNALKFFDDKGEFITAQQYRRLEKIVERRSWNYMPYDRLGKIEYDDSAIERHIRDVLRVKAISKAKIKDAAFKVVVDAINGAGSKALPDFLETLGVQVVRINCKNNGDFFRKPEPVPGNLAELGKAVKRHRADLGMACDPDADRLALVDEKGRPIGEEMTLALAAAYYLRKKRGPVVINLSTSRVTADAARSHGARVFLSPVGEANVIAEMKKRKAVIGGEGNGGVILPECHYGRDALVAAGLVMAFLAETGKSLAELSGTLPAYTTIKKKASLPDGFERKLNRVEKYIRAEFGHVKIDTRDGLRFDLEDGWVQVRKSNTEPIYRLIAEARTRVRARQLAQAVNEALA
jgi:phosphomannomutase